MKCVKCSKEIQEQDKCFMLRSIPFISNVPAIAICEDCAETTTVMDLYMVNKILMRNSDDDAIDVDGVVVAENSEYGKALVGEEEVLYDNDPRTIHPTDDEIYEAIETMNAEEFANWFQYASTDDGDENTPSTLMGKSAAARYYNDRIEHVPLFDME